jgi:nitrite reductase/ring-hydroxylating ferredoxin subunit
MVQTEFVEGAKASEIPDGKEVLTANVGGKFYAISHSCSHMNAMW